jgi:hypothetical protein
VDGDVEPHINISGRFQLTPAQKARAPELIPLFRQLPARCSSFPAACILKAILDGHRHGARAPVLPPPHSSPWGDNYRYPTQQYQFREMQYPGPASAAST